ncbi:MAG: tetratricopeptide repeat protein, partial [Pyrinomonadaceae bacterium]
MYKNNELKKSPLKFGFAVIATVCASLVSAQDIVPVSDITGGTSVFIFRGAARAVSRQFVTTTRARRSKTDRIETSKRVTKQYSKLAKIDPRRTRTDVVRPDDPRLRVRRTLEKDVGSRLLAGVGEYYMDRDDYNQAIDFFRDSLTMDANNAISKAGLSEALALKGNELLAKDAFPVARKFFEESLIYNDKNAPAYFGLAEVLTELDQTEAAAANYEKALSFDKELTEIYVPLGILYYQAGDIAKADNLLTKAVALDPNDAQSQLYLGLIRLSQARESGAQTRDKEALTAFNKAKSVDPKLAEAFYGAGVANSRLGDNRQAVTEFEQAVVLKSNY